MLWYATRHRMGQGQSSRARDHGKGVLHKQGGEAEHGRDSPKRRNPAAGRREPGKQRAVLCAEPLESLCGFQMKSIFVLQNLKPPLPRVYDRDK